MRACASKCMCKGKGVGYYAILLCLKNHVIMLMCKVIMLMCNVIMLMCTGIILTFSPRNLTMACDQLILNEFF